MNKVGSIAVIGLGYVGLPVALLAEKKGFEVVGIEISKSKLEKLEKRLPIIDDETANARLKESKIDFTDDLSKIKNVDAVIICVPTPVDKDKMPDLSLVESAVINSAKHMKEGSLLVIESTINPGVCDELVIPAIESNTKHVVGKSIFLAHCPERINPGDSKWSVDNINRVVGASSTTGLDLACDMYSRLISGTIQRMGSLKEAEAVKIVENSFRDVNIAFVNELAMSFEALGINVKNVIEGAATKPFGFMPFFPGIGVGGHCIPVDPYYLIEYAKGRGFDHHFLTLARSINESMPIYSVDTLEKALISKANKSLKDSAVLVLGLSYKPNVADDRESPSYKVIETLESRGAKVKIYDPFYPDKSTDKNLEDAVQGSDAAILVTAHDAFIKTDINSFKGLSLFFDGRNALAEKQSSFQKLNITYLALGS